MTTPKAKFAGLALIAALCGVGMLGLSDIVKLIDDAAPKPGPRGSYKKRGMTDVAGRS